MITLTEEIGRLVNEISQRSQEIKEQFLKTWIATNLPHDLTSLDDQVNWIMNNCAIQETWSDDMKTVTWQLIERHRIKE